MPFEINAQVVHPQHGVGRVIKLEQKQSGPGQTRLYYEITVAKGTIWVPVDGPPGQLRRLTTKDDLAQYRVLLKSCPTALDPDHRQRQLELAGRLKQGSFQSRCEVVRDLMAHGWHKPLNEGNSILLRLARGGLYQEWAAVEEVSIFEATHEVEALLLEGRQIHEK